MPNLLTDAARILDRAADALRDIAAPCPYEGCGCLWCDAIRKVDALRDTFLLEQKRKDAITDEPRRARSPE